MAGRLDMLLYRVISLWAAGEITMQNNELLVRMKKEMRHSVIFFVNRRWNNGAKRYNNFKLGCFGKENGNEA